MEYHREVVKRPNFYENIPTYTVSFYLVDISIQLGLFN